jgi:hypothetical protein
MQPFVESEKQSVARVACNGLFVVSVLMCISSRNQPLLIFLDYLCHLQDIVEHGCLDFACDTCDRPTHWHVFGRVVVCFDSTCVRDGPVEWQTIVKMILFNIPVHLASTLIRELPLAVNAIYPAAVPAILRGCASKNLVIEHENAGEEFNFFVTDMDAYFGFLANCPEVLDGHLDIVDRVKLRTVLFGKLITLANVRDYLSSVRFSSELFESLEDVTDDWGDLAMDLSITICEHVELGGDDLIRGRKENPIIVGLKREFPTEMKDKGNSKVFKRGLSRESSKMVCRALAINVEKNLEKVERIMKGEISEKVPLVPSPFAHFFFCNN